MNPSPLRAAISSAYLEDEEAVTDRLIAKARLSPEERAATETLARDLVLRIRETRGEQTGVDSLMQEYALSTQEGVVLMCLAESLLRVPDAATADKLIKDKIGSADWDKHKGQSDSMFVNASTWALMLTGRVVKLDTTAGWDFEGILRRLVSRTGEPVIRQAVTYAMRILGQQFVLGRSIEEAMKNGKPWLSKGYRFSFDMLGEAAYTAHDARRYYKSYQDAVRAIAKAALEAGAEVTAVVLKKYDYEEQLPGAKLIFVETEQERFKELTTLNNPVACFALPGGAGTLREVMQAHPAETAEHARADHQEREQRGAVHDARRHDVADHHRPVEPREHVVLFRVVREEEPRRVGRERPRDVVIDEPRREEHLQIDEPR